MGAALFSFWCHVGNAEFSLGYLGELERFFGGQKKEKRRDKQDLCVYFGQFEKLGIGLFLWMRFFLFRGKTFSCKFLVVFVQFREVFFPSFCTI